METVIDSLTTLGQYGLIGLYLALVGLCALLAWGFYKFASNHTEHSNEIFNRNTEALTKLCTIIDLKLK